ncbi:MAG TPA: serine/threonine-protein kinase, partial [Acidobacteriota bacterium]|nr:serine/threonine-protein kinase [Acidobacteriota bacterium]
MHKGILTEKIVQTLSDEVVAFRLLQTQAPDNTLLLAQSGSGTVTETTLAFQPAPEPLHLASVSQLPTQMATPGATPHQSAPKSGINRELEFRQVGRYEIVRRIGEGGMGTVYEAFDPLLKRPVALKFLIKDNPTLVQRLLMEGRSQAQIDHPHVCKVYEVGEFEGRYFIAMQYLPGQTLDKAMAGLSVEQKVKIMAEVADALQAAHKEGLIHRDIKPHNIIVGTGEDGLLKPYVMDFGLARQVAASGMTVEGALLGTPYYMSPEQARGETDRLDRRTDIYSLGVTLYELLSGKVPFSQGSIMEVLLKVIQDEAPALRSLDSRIPVDLETIVMKCLAKEPQQRYDSARALQDDLLRFLAGEPIQGRPVSAWFRAKRLLYKHRVAASIVAAALGIGLFFLVSGVHALWQARQQSELARQLGERVKEIETIMRHGHMLPRHNIAREEAMVRERMQAVEATMNSFGKISEGPGHYAIGRGHL